MLVLSLAAALTFSCRGVDVLDTAGAETELPACGDCNAVRTALDETLRCGISSIIFSCRCADEGTSPVDDDATHEDGGVFDDDGAGASKLAVSGVFERLAAAARKMPFSVSGIAGARPTGVL